LKDTWRFETGARRCPAGEDSGRSDGAVVYKAKGEESRGVMRQLMAAVRSAGGAVHSILSVVLKCSSKSYIDIDSDFLDRES